MRGSHVQLEIRPSSGPLMHVPDAWMRCCNPPVKKDPSLVKPYACSSNSVGGTRADRHRATSFSWCSSVARAVMSASVGCARNPRYSLRPLPGVETSTRSSSR
jgi:hypothetical protein